MDLASNFRMLARYNQRMNAQLLDVCQQLTSEQLHQDTHAFFPSVMNHWNHILFGDLIMLQRLSANKIVTIDESLQKSLPVATGIHDTFTNNLDELLPLRAKVDQIYIEMTQGFNATTCTKIVRYTTTEGNTIEKNVGEFCQHIFNHQTHHRGQLTALLSQFGLAFGCTDLPMIVPEGSKA
ncbi:damage-inducible protein DinB [Vibrio sp. ZSDE26]|uniref:Damage-inducible protein DinB n=1 Tax=Vibrio amylolyticus TaxID=2847292 RepID=A0A9X1XRB6_9VIBR|nr:DinB family protein [Vibrio amylolyticus]MCK6264159.1 damage-inducible protein DinB [Vibrio amylolyticus]